MHAVMCWEAIVCWIYSYRLPGGSAVECFLLFEQQHCANLGKGRCAREAARSDVRGAASQQIRTINEIFFSRSNVIERTEDAGAGKRTS